MFLNNPRIYSPIKMFAGINDPKRTVTEWPYLLNIFIIPYNIGEFPGGFDPIGFSESLISGGDILLIKIKGNPPRLYRATRGGGRGGNHVPLGEGPDPVSASDITDIAGRVSSKPEKSRIFVVTDDTDFMRAILRSAAAEGDLIGRTSVIRLHYKDMLDEMFIEILEGKEALGLTESGFDLGVT